MSRAMLLLGSLLLSTSTVDLDRKEGPKRVAIDERKDADLTGYWNCRGSEGLGKHYTGVVVVKKKDDVYSVQWILESGANFSGVGIFREDTFSVGWALPTEKGIVKGVNVYKFNGSTLAGRWGTMPGDGTLRSEIWTFLKKMDD